MSVHTLQCLKYARDDFFDFSPISNRENPTVFVSGRLTKRWKLLARPVRDVAFYKRKFSAATYFYLPTFPGRHGTERGTAVHDGNESHGQGQVQGVRRIGPSVARRPDDHGATDIHLDRREEPNYISRFVRPVQRRLLEPFVVVTAVVRGQCEPVRGTSGALGDSGTGTVGNILTAVGDRLTLFKKKKKKPPVTVYTRPIVVANGFLPKAIKKKKKFSTGILSFFS